MNSEAKTIARATNKQNMVSTVGISNEYIVDEDYYFILELLRINMEPKQKILHSLDAFLFQATTWFAIPADSLQSPNLRRKRWTGKFVIVCKMKPDVIWISSLRVNFNALIFT